MLKHYGEICSFLKPAERNISGLPKFKYLLFFNLYHTSWVTKRKVMIMMKEKNVEDEVTHHQLRGLEKTEVAVCLFLKRVKHMGKEGIINLHQNLGQNLYHILPKNLH